MIEQFPKPQDSEQEIQNLRKIEFFFGKMRFWTDQCLFLLGINASAAITLTRVFVQKSLDKKYM